MPDKKNTSYEIEEAGPEVAIVPIGSTEQHGKHLPIATDTMIAEAVAEAAGRKLGALVLPALPVSTCKEQLGRVGSYWVDSDTFYHVIKDIVLSLKLQGFKKIVLLISHGGVFIAGPAIRDINARDDEIKVIKVDLVSIFGSKEILELLEHEDDLHAGEVETSLMLHLDEKLVRKDKIEDHVPDVPRDHLNYRSLTSFCENGVWGWPGSADKAKGKAIFERTVEASIRYIEETFETLGDAGYMP